MTPAARAWAGLAAYVIAVDLAARPGQQLSDGSQRAFKRRPVVTGLAIGITGAHLAGLLPKPVDPYSAVFRAWQAVLVKRLQWHEKAAQRDAGRLSVMTTHEYVGKASWRHLSLVADDSG